MAKLRGPDGRGRPIYAVPLLLAVALPALASVSLASGAPGREAKVCHAPRLTGLTLYAARLRARHAGCELRLRGSKLEQARVQTIDRQLPSTGRPSSDVTVWLNPFCHSSVAYPPHIQEPTVTAGPTELLSGFYVVGGPVKLFSTPRCRLPEPQPDGGTVEVTNAAGTLVASVTSTAGHLAEIPLPAGSYTIRGTFGEAQENALNPSSQSLVITAGHTVRQDFFLDVP